MWGLRVFDQLGGIHLEDTRGFLKSEAVDEDPPGILHKLVIGWYDSVTAMSTDAAHKLRVAEILTERGRSASKSSALKEASNWVNEEYEKFVHGVVYGR